MSLEAAVLVVGRYSHREPNRQVRTQVCRPSKCKAGLPSAASSLANSVCVIYRICIQCRMICYSRDVGLEKRARELPGLDLPLLRILSVLCLCLNTNHSHHPHSPRKEAGLAYYVCSKLLSRRSCSEVRLLSSVLLLHCCSC